MGGGYVRNSARRPPSYSFSNLVPLRHWARDPALRSWPVLLLVALVCVPPIALVMLNHPTPATVRDIAWIFAVYFAVAWLLLLGVIVRPQHVSRAMLAAIAVVGVVTQAPIAILLETELHAGTSSLLDIFTIGLPEELAKAIPIVVVAFLAAVLAHPDAAGLPVPRRGERPGVRRGRGGALLHRRARPTSGHATGPNLQALTSSTSGASSPTRSTTPAGPGSPATSSGWPSPARTGSTRSPRSGSASRRCCTASTTGTRSTPTSAGSWSR